MRFLYTLTVFISSALLFLVQPMIAKIILPRFGGSPAVWNASMLFFQAALLCGYAYAHWSTKHLGVKRQPWTHIAIMAVAGLTIRFSLPAGLNSQGAANPTLQLLALLAVTIGASFVVVSAGASLLQTWFGSTSDPAAKDPYFLYAASNLGSMAALLGYPLLMEPSLKLSEQGRVWTWGYFALVALMAVCATVTKQKPAQPDQESKATEPLTNKQRLTWVGLAAIPSSLLLGVTTYLTSNVAPIPLLWVIPLTIYLLTFILAFARKNVTNVPILARILPLLVTPLTLIIILESNQSNLIVFLAGMHLATFFVAAWMCHGRLSASRPDPTHLTEFYLWIAVGGVVGGAFNALLAPVAFNTLIEYPLALVAACLMRPRISGSASKLDWIYPLAVGVLSATVYFATNAAGLPPGAARTALTIGLPAILCFFAVDNPVRFGAALGVVFVLSQVLHTASDSAVLLTERSFFGVHRVLSDGKGRFTKLVHGTTLHGIQDHQNPKTPLTYYHPSGPIGQVFTEFFGPRAKAHIAVVGLGIGSLAAYGQPGQTITYYEIDPVVEKIARDTRYFTFLSDSTATVDVVLGDARLRLADAPSAHYGILALDAFSSDAIPVHLLTEDAFRMYLSKLEPHGILAVHISNHYLDLEPVVGAVARDLGLVAMIQLSEASDDERQIGKLQSTWMILARDKADFQGLNKNPEWSLHDPDPREKAWTDDYSNVLGAFKAHE